MGKGKTFGGLGIGLIVSTITTAILAKKGSDILNVAQKNFGSVSSLLKSLTSRVIEKKMR